MSIVIRGAGPDDAEVLARLNGVVQQIHLDARPDFFGPAHHAGLPAWFRTQLADAGTRCFIAEAEGRAVAYLLAFVREQPANCFCPARKWMEVDQIAVETTQRRAGIARALIETAEVEARRVGATVLELNVWCFNDAAHEAFEQLGFRARAIKMERSL